MVSLLAEHLILLVKTRCLAEIGAALQTLSFSTLKPCYYQAIDFAISNKLKRVEVGAQGHHKLQRGYLPTLTHSTHLISNFSFRSAVGDFLKQEARQVLFEQQELAKMSPFKD